MKSSVALLLLSLISLQTMAAPMPGTSSSPLVSRKPGLFLAPQGFQMDSAQTAWIQSAPPEHIPSLVTIYKAPISSSGQQPALSVRVDNLRRPQPLKTYVKKWMKDYTRFGFDVLTAKPIKLGSNSAFLLDIVSRETQKQLRQVVLIKNKTAVILTCRDGRDSFAKTVQDCNEIMKTFQWTQTID